MLPEEPIGAEGLRGFASRLREGAITSEEATRGYLERIEMLDPRLGAYDFVAREAALVTARAIDGLLRAGTDLGPLMGVPVAIKDLIAVEGMPTTAGTHLDVADLVGAEGPVVGALRRAGCVILGKVKTVEFALGITGISSPRGTPWNPWDAGTRRLPGGSSSGPGVATAAGLCAFALGSDTGGSVRVPAAMNGIVGLKTSFGVLSNEGAFPLASHLDTIGPLTRSVDDAAIVFSLLTGSVPEPASSLSGLRLGRPTNYFLDGLDPEVADRFEAALALLRERGCTIVDMELPEAPARERYFPVSLPVSLVAALGRERAEAGLDRMDPVIAVRVRSAFNVDAITLAALERERTALRASALARLSGFDALISPTTANLPPAFDDLAQPDAALAAALGMTRNTQPANYLDLCAISLPLPMGGFHLPAGLQLMAPPRGEARLLAVATAIEELLGTAARADLAAFMD